MAPRPPLAALAAAAALAVAASAGPAVAAEGCVEPWPLWDAYLQRFVSSDGRVVDLTGGGHSTSEGQAYAMILALVAGDRATFDAVLRWAEDNLAGGDLAERLPAWKWGRRDDGGWGVVDDNAASDADLWIAYALVEAGRLWGDPALSERGRGLARRIADEEVEAVPELGPMLLPGPHGFRLGEGRWRINPSYLPVQVLRGLAGAGAPGPWAEMVPAAVQLIRDSAPHGFAPDWVEVRRGGEVVADPVSGSVGSHDAIRVYLWAAMLHDDDPAKAVLGARLQGPLRVWRDGGAVPERVDPRTGAVLAAHGPVGFTAALLPWVRDLGRPGEWERLWGEIELTAADGLYGQPAHYYDQNLLLFATAFVEGRLRFDAGGRLDTSWEESCVASFED